LKKGKAVPNSSWGRKENQKVCTVKMYTNQTNLQAFKYWRPSAMYHIESK
jgi:hypothetical protein